MNNTIMRLVTVTGTYAPIAAASTVASVNVSCPPGNTGYVYIRGDLDEDVPLEPGEWHDLRRVDLAELNVKGTPGDVVKIIGGTW